MTMSPSPVPTTSNVVLTAIDMPFWRLVGFFFKATLAALPGILAAVILVSVTLRVLWWALGGWRYGSWDWM